MTESIYFSTIKIFGRTDQDTDSLSNFQIYIGQNSDYTKNVPCNHGELFSGDGEFKCEWTGKYVTIVKPMGGTLTLCEVEGYSEE